MMLFTVKNYTDEFLIALDNKNKLQLPDDDETVAATAEEIIESTKDFILKELGKHLKGHNLELFIADLLNRAFPLVIDTF